MIVIEKLLTKNPYSRSGRSLREHRGVILHFVGIRGQRAHTTWDFFERICPRDKHFSSAHDIIDLNGDVLHCVPYDEVAHHCGSLTTDPISGQVYTDWARKKFPKYTNDPQNNSPNNCTIGLELCIDTQGNFTQAVVDSACRRTEKLLKAYNLDTDDIGHHKMVVGWKNCPAPWIDNPALFLEFKERVKNLLEGK